MNAHASENYLAISRSSSASKRVEIFWAEIYWGRLIFRAESSLIQSSCRSFIRVIVSLRERGYETSGSPLRFMLRRSSLVECVSVLHGTGVYKASIFFLLRQYVQPCLLKNPKYTFYTTKSSLKLAYYLIQVIVASAYNLFLEHALHILLVYLR